MNYHHHGQAAPCFKESHNESIKLGVGLADSNTFKASPSQISRPLDTIKQTLNESFGARSSCSSSSREQPFQMEKANLQRKKGEVESRAKHLAKQKRGQNCAGSCNIAEIIGSKGPADKEAPMRQKIQTNLLELKDQTKQNKGKEKIQNSSNLYEIKINLVEDPGLSESDSDSESGSGSKKNDSEGSLSDIEENLLETTSNKKNQVVTPAN